MRGHLPSALTCIISCILGFEGSLHGQKHSTAGMNTMFVNARAPDYPPAYKHSELKKVIREANSPEEYDRLANYFDFRAMESDQKAQDELKELERLLALRFHARSYPPQVDSARELLRWYETQAQKYSSCADAYHQLAISTDRAR